MKVNSGDFLQKRVFGIVSGMYRVPIWKTNDNNHLVYYNSFLDGKYWPIKSLFLPKMGRGK